MRWKMKYYKSNGYETWDYIEAHGLNYLRGNIVKYITRAGKKDPKKELEDLCKARHYLAKEIERVIAKQGLQEFK